MLFLYMCNAPRAYSAHESQKKVLNPLGVELQKVMNHHVLAGNETQVL